MSMKKMYNLTLKREIQNWDNTPLNVRSALFASFFCTTSQLNLVWKLHLPLGRGLLSEAQSAGSTSPWCLSPFSSFTGATRGDDDDDGGDEEDDDDGDATNTLSLLRHRILSGVKFDIFIIYL